MTAGFLPTRRTPLRRAVDHARSLVELPGWMAGALERNHRRRLVAPAFTRRRINTYAERMRALAGEVPHEVPLKYLRRCAK